MRTTILVTAMLVAAGCGCPEAHELSMEGNAPPRCVAEVLAVAQQHCDRPIVGTLRWTDRPDPNGPLNGHCAWDGSGCPMKASVVFEPARYSHPETASARDTAMAHEIGHWCLLSEDESVTQAWADTVNRETVCDPPSRR